MLEQITPLVLTLNEEANIQRVLARLEWAREVVVLDSGSSDATRTLLTRFKNVRCVERKFDCHAAQWNYGVTATGITTEWILALDADYVLPDVLVEEIRALTPTSDTMGYRVGFRYCVLGRVLRGTLYPPVIAIYRRANAHYVQDGHTQRLRVSGRIETLHSTILHDDRKPLSTWLASQLRYAQLEADLLCSRSWREVGWPDRLRKLVVVMAPFAFFYCMIVGRGILDGAPGLYYAFQRAVAEAILSLVLVERHVSSIRNKDRVGK